MIRTPVYKSNTKTKKVGFLFCSNVFGRKTNFVEKGRAGVGVGGVLGWVGVLGGGVFVGFWVYMVFFLWVGCFFVWVSKTKKAFTPVGVAPASFSIERFAAGSYTVRNELSGTILPTRSAWGRREFPTPVFILFGVGGVFFCFFLSSVSLWLVGGAIVTCHCFVLPPPPPPD